MDNKFYNKGKQFENQFWGYFGGPEGVFNDQTRPILFSSYPLTHIYVHVK